MIVLGVALVFHLLIPAALLSWQWWGVERSRTAWVLKTVVIGAYWLLLLTAGVWAVIPWYVGYLYVAVWALTALAQYRRVSSQAAMPTGRLRVVVYVTATLACLAGAVHAMRGHRPFDEAAVDLAFPLRGGTYYVISGGSNALMNLHVATLHQRYRHIRGQSYALDIVKLNRFGTRSSVPIPGKLTDYETFDVAVYAPCAGVAARSENTRPDLDPPEHDRVNLNGNFVAIDCKGVRVLIAHLKHGSVRVVAGDPVTEGQLLGQIGNSGNTDEPHLHIHAERPADRDALMSGEPVPLVFSGRFLARNDRVRPPR